MKIINVLTIILWMTLSCCCIATTTKSDDNDASTSEKFKQFWYERNSRLISEKLQRLNLKPESLPKVKNVILFIGDGMGSTTLTATRVFKSQKLSRDEKLIFDHFPASSFVRTDSLNSQIPDSASAATALFCGVKTNFEYVGFDSRDGTFSCENQEAETQSIISWAQQKNLKTG
jgi:alkaline phosphatase